MKLIDGNEYDWKYIYNYINSNIDQFVIQEPQSHLKKWFLCL